jgi:hypothetical protein
MSQFILNGKPIGVEAPKSAIDTLKNLCVKAEKIGDKIIVAKEDLLKKLKEKKSIFYLIWKNATVTSFQFNCTDCVELNS